MNETTATTIESKPSETLEDRIARLEAEKAKRDAAQDERAKQIHADALELEARYVEEIGPLGVEIAVVETVEGAFVLRRTDFVNYKRFVAAQKNDTWSQEALQTYVEAALVFPERTTAREIWLRRPGAVNTLANALAGLHTGKRGDLEKK